jgi:hypothetical protein
VLLRGSACASIVVAQPGCLALITDQRNVPPLVAGHLIKDEAMHIAPMTARINQSLMQMIGQRYVIQHRKVEER